MRPGEIDDKLFAQVTREFKKRRNLNVDLDATTILVDILNEWLGNDRHS